jgi:hypothetical protein
MASGSRQARARRAAFTHPMWMWVLLSGLVVTLLQGRAGAQPCTGDCDGDGEVTVDELIRGVNIALGHVEVSQCDALDADHDGVIRIFELVLAVNRVLDRCPVVATATPSPTETPSVTATPGDGAITIADAVARSVGGQALLLGMPITTMGVVTVDAGVFANGKLKVFAQDAGAGIMVYHQTSADVPAFHMGDRLRVSGIIRQVDPTGGGDNPANGTVLVDLTAGSWTTLDTGNPLPTPLAATASDIASDGVRFVGILVHVMALHKVTGDWPRLGDRSTEVTVGDDSGTTLAMRFQRPTITAGLDSVLQSIGSGAFNATAIVVQDDRDGDATLLSGFQLWVRGADDIEPAAAP